MRSTEKLKFLYSIIQKITKQYDLVHVPESTLLHECRKYDIFNDNTKDSIVRAGQRLSNALCLTKWSSDTTKSMQKYNYVVHGTNNPVDVCPMFNLGVKETKRLFRPAGKRVVTTGLYFPKEDAVYSNETRAVLAFHKLMRIMGNEVDNLTEKENEVVKKYIIDY